MSSMDQRQSSSDEQQVGTRPGQQASGLLATYSPMEQLPFPERVNVAEQPSPEPPSSQHPERQQSSSPGVAWPPVHPTAAPNITRSLIDPMELAKMMGEGEGDVLPLVRKTSSLREPLVIPGSGKSSGLRRPPRGRRLVVHIAVTSLLLFIMLSTLLAVLPTGGGASGNFGIFKPIIDIVNSKGNNTALISSQAATATAVTQDGFDPGVNVGQFAGIPTPPPGYSGTGNRFYYGQCTYWAAMRYHALTGKWVPWLGNANQWHYGALNSGWIASSTPKMHSILVMQAGVQGAGWYGHVAIVEQINPDGSVVTSNWNWLGNWGRTTMETFRPGPGISFVYAPGY